MRRIIAAAPIFALACLAMPAAAQEGFRIAGYLPDYRVAGFDLANARSLTDLILFSAQVTPEGKLDLGGLKDAPWDELRRFKTRERVRLILCVGGWERSAGFAAVATSDEKRAAFVREAVATCLERRLDGLDLDWEHPKDAAEQGGYARLLADLRAAFAPHGLVLSVTMAAWQQIPPEGFAAADWVQVMSYDNKGKHSTPEQAAADVKSLLDRKVSPGKIVLGVPFYGRQISGPEKTLTYAEILAKHRPAPGADEAGGVYYNGPETISRKTRDALRAKLGGVMIWEIGQDAPGDRSLLRTIRTTVDRGPAR